MQPETTTLENNISINPRVLTDKELVRLADHYIYPDGLPIEWQKTLVDRLAARTL
jgi:hypothetical protein